MSHRDPPPVGAGAGAANLGAKTSGSSSGSGEAARGEGQGVTANRERSALREIWRASPPLVALGLLMTAVLPLHLAAIGLDPRLVTGAPAWLKPAKFVFSTATFAFTLAWLLTYLPQRLRLRRWAGAVTSGALLIEIVLIDLQAARGRPSHFNVGRALDVTIVMIMALAIGALCVAVYRIVRALFEAPINDHAVALIIRSSLLLTLVGTALTGALMVTPRPAQVRQLLDTGHASAMGAHTIGAADGGPGLEFAGWSAGHGDLRVPHFFSLHAIQVLPLMFFATRRIQRGKRSGRRLAKALVVAYGAMMLFLTAEALSGRPLTWRPSAMPTADTIFALCTVVAACGWLCLLCMPKRRTLAAISGYGLPVALSLVYMAVVALNWHGTPGGFASLTDVSLLFGNRWLLLAGWIHYLAFDLFVGGWMVRDARDRQIPHPWLVPCLALTFLFGPMGLLLYLGVRRRARLVPPNLTA